MDDLESDGRARLAPGILDWVQARLLRALQGGTTFASISQAQEWLGQQVAQNFYDPKDGYTFDMRRLLGPACRRLFSATTA